MPKKFKRGAAKRHDPATRKRRAAKSRSGTPNKAAGKKKRPNAKVVGSRAAPPKKSRSTKPKRRVGKPNPRPAGAEPQTTAQTGSDAALRRRTRRTKTAPEMGLEARPSARLPVVAIVGRPNVGKSSLFNRLAGSRISIEDPRPGTTRDRVSASVRLNSESGAMRIVELFDTAGIGVVDEASVQDHVHEQIENAIASADVILFVADVRDGVLELDRQTAAALRRAGRPVLLAANKADDPKLDPLATSFYELGLGDALPVSAKGGRNVKALRESLCALLPPKTDAETLDPPELLLAIVGRRNAGKSTLVNAMVEDDRVIASELEGTTRDSVDVRFTYKDKTFVAIDTAGVRKRRSLQHSVEFFGQSRSFRAIRRASVVVLLLDAREAVTKIDTQLVEMAMKECKPLIIAVNKWDLAQGRKTEEFEQYLRRKLNQVTFAPIVFLSAKDGRNVFPLIDLARELHAQAGHRVGTGELNRLVYAAFERHHPQPRKNRLGRIFYATQVQVYPPQIVLFVNDPELFPDNWRTYLAHQLQQNSEFAEIPIRIKFKAREKIALGE